MYVVFYTNSYGNCICVSFDTESDARTYMDNEWKRKIEKVLENEEKGFDQLYFSTSFIEENYAVVNTKKFTMEWRLAKALRGPKYEVA